MTFDYNAAELAILEVLGKVQDEFDDQFVITEVIEQEFGWVFFFNTKGYVQTGNPSSRLAGNSPLIFDKTDGLVYITGTADSLETYLEQYRRGVRTRA